MHFRSFGLSLVNHLCHDIDSITSARVVTTDKGMDGSGSMVIPFSDRSASSGQRRCRASPWPHGQGPSSSNLKQSAPKLIMSVMPHGRHSGRKGVYS